MTKQRTRQHKIAKNPDWYVGACHAKKRYGPIMLPAQYAMNNCQASVAEEKRKKPRQKQSRKQTTPYYIIRTMALTVAFLVNPPKLPETSDIVSGKLPVYAFVKIMPKYRPHCMFAGK